MTQAQRARKLQSAALLVKEVAESLNTDSAACKSCGLRNFKNFEEAKSNKELAAIAERLEAMSVKFGSSAVEVENQQPTGDRTAKVRERFRAR